MNRIKVVVTFDKCDPITFVCLEGEHLLATMREADAAYISMCDAIHGIVVDAKGVATPFTMKIKGVPGPKPSSKS